MEIAEHFYTDDPDVGHPDVRTRLPATDYFFLGNGHLQAAVQLCSSVEGTPLGLLILDPVRFGPKRAALTMEEDRGLAGTMVEVEVGGEWHRPGPDTVRAVWSEVEGVPAVRVEWEAGPVVVVERFLFAEGERPILSRLVEVWPGGSAAGASGEGGSHRPRLRLAGTAAEVHAPAPGSDGVCRRALVYVVVDGSVRVGWVRVGGGGERSSPGGAEDSSAGGSGGASWPWPGPSPARRVVDYWDRIARLRTSDRDLNYLFAAARAQLPAAVDRRGRMDGSIWQYNLEWVRDQAHVAEALVRLGDTAKSRTMLSRLLDEFVSPEGDTVDSGTRREASDVELDQNGELLAALATYVDWTGDLEPMVDRWERIRALATFPIQERFRHRPSGLLHNRREYWERHALHGIQDGFELMSQFFVALGLERAAGLADALGEAGDAEAWRSAAAEIRRAMLEDPLYRLVEDGHLIKRKGTDGAWQRTIDMDAAEGVPDQVPLLREGPHFLDPDASAALPIAHAFIDPRGGLALGTLQHLEGLWNTSWESGGYGRYHASSEPDSPGAWPFASLFIARAAAEAGEYEKVWRILRWLRSTPGGNAGTWFENDGPRISPPYPQVGVTPWTWAEMITLFVHHLLGIRPGRTGITVRPLLLSGLKEMEADLFVRGHRLHVRVRRAGAGESPAPGGVRLPLPEADTEVEVLC